MKLTKRGELVLAAVALLVLLGMPVLGAWLLGPS